MIIVDYEPYNQPYLSLVSNAPAIGGCVNKFLSALKTNRGLNSELLHLIGHSMGAHVAGLSTKNLNVRRITGIKNLSKFLCNFMHVLFYHIILDVFGLYTF